MTFTPENPQDRGKWTSASAAMADLLCPGRYNAQKDLPEPAGPKKDADFGNAVHEALAKNDPSKLDLKQHDIFESCQKIEAKVLGDYFGADAPQAIERAVREKRFWLNIIEKNYWHSGQVDVVFRYGKKALINDYKSLNSEIADSPNNQQLRDLAVLVWDSIPLLEELAVCLTQPLVTHSPTLCLYHEEEINQARAEMVERIIKNHDPYAPRVAGEVQCAHCRAKTGCAQWSEWSAGKLPVPVHYVHTPMDLWTPEMWDIFLRNKGAAAKWIEIGEAEAKRRLKENPNAIPGWYLKPGAKPRPINNPNEVFARFESKGGKLEAYMNTVAITKEKLKKELAAVTGLKGKALDEAFDQLVDGCVDEWKQNEPSLAPIKERNKQ